MFLLVYLIAFNQLEYKSYCKLNLSYLLWYHLFRGGNNESQSTRKAIKNPFCWKHKTSDFGERIKSIASPPPPVHNWYIFKWPWRKSTAVNLSSESSSIQNTTNHFAQCATGSASLLPLKLSILAWEYWVVKPLLDRKSRMLRLGNEFL